MLSITNFRHHYKLQFTSASFCNALYRSTIFTGIFVVNRNLGYT
jgi:hypothetical protein